MYEMITYLTSLKSILTLFFNDLSASFNFTLATWLNPRDLPSTFLKCRNCQEELVFVCQFYAPADDINPEEAYHRSFYVFACKNKKCCSISEGTTRVLRVQLPKVNQFYPHDASEEHEGWTKHHPESWGNHLCKVCGQIGKGKCPTQGHYFCGKHHQKEHKSFVFDRINQKGKDDCDTSPEASSREEQMILPSVFNESELVVEDEPQDAQEGNGNSNTLKQSTLFPSNTSNKQTTSNQENTSTPDDEDEDKNLEQEDLNKMTGASTYMATDESVWKDETTMEFYNRINKFQNVQEQVLRYCRHPNSDERNDAPLWICSNVRPDKIPHCPYCQSKRKFEFQIMPQMLHYLLKGRQALRRDAEEREAALESDKAAVLKASSVADQAPSDSVPANFSDLKENAVKDVRKRLLEDDGNFELDWGIIAVYTCIKSCSAPAENGSAYLEEYSWKQPSLDA